ncbi:tubulin-specific chaperone E [Teleopsis dalmanni]|uniref:tubulin-specific chaperone E n=1 Tax=Teleopsis dalmanni TaxID=139649 RepID=UPI0018CF1C8A|nr:tubulin-specific chaperone E [Teleopsis dalmanni]
MVGIIDEAQIKFPIGSRIKIGNNCGTVKYVGEVIGQTGTWLGIEWDDFNRGKHSGCVQNKHYFQTQHPTAGSFVRPAKVGPFETLEQAARERYLGYTSHSLDQNLIREAQQSLNASLFEIVGMEKIARKQSKFEELTDISVDDSPINSPGCLKDFTSLTTLNLSRTLIWNWETVADIVAQISTLRNLNLSSNYLQLPRNEQINDLEPAFRNLKHINLRNCGLNWVDVLHVAKLWPQIQSLSLQENPISELSEVNCKNIFKNLRELDLHCTKLVDFKQICKLGNITTLRCLNIMNNAIEEIKLPDCESNEKLNIFLELENINLFNNPIWNEADAFNELDKLPKLRQLSKTPHLKSSFDEMFSKAVSMIMNLDVLNKVKIDPKERRGAEYDTWKKYAVEWVQASKSNETLHEFYKKHRSYEILIKKYGSAAAFIPIVNAKKSNLIKLRIENKKTGEMWEKKVPRVITVQTLQGLIVKHFNLELLNMPHISYADTKYPDLVVQLDNISKTLDFYSIQDNDKIIVNW